MNVTCRTCGVDFEVPEIGQLHVAVPAFNQCRACFCEAMAALEENDEPPELDATPVIRGDDPDNYLFPDIPGAPD